AGGQDLLGQVEGRTSRGVVDWLQVRTPKVRAVIRLVVIDPAAVYGNAIRSQCLLPTATLVVDHFHLVKLANHCVTTVRRRVIRSKKAAAAARSTQPGRTGAGC